MYCKWETFASQLFRELVLIVAKCIVNISPLSVLNFPNSVLIVAKCIVNDNFIADLETETDVLIVAKCIVNAEVPDTLKALSKY